SMTRYNTDGSLDTTFDGDGFATADFGSGNDYGHSVTVQSDGKILVAGYSYNGSDHDFGLVRYNADGTLDTTFDSNTTLDGTPTITEHGAAVVLDANVEISDAELDALNSGSGNYSGASLTLVRNGGTNSNDVFSESGTLSALTESGNLVVGGTTIGTVTTNSGGTLVLTFNTNATTALVNSAMQQIAYSNSSGTLSDSVQIDWSFDDGNSGSQGTGGTLQGTGSTTVSITVVNSAPTAANNTVTTNEDTTYTFTASDFSFSDVDNDAMSSVKITSLESIGSLQLSGIDVTVNQVITKADIDAGNLTFVPVTAQNGSGYDSFGFSVNDGSLDSVSSYTMTLDVTAVNDASTFSNPAFSSNTISTDADGARDVQVVDMDGDGDMDVLSASSNDGEIVWYENDGSENFTAHTITTISATPESAYSVQVADLDGDGDMDVFSASYADDEIAWYENDGSENFTTHVIDSSTTANGAT
ncbi:MAG: hypothetical protein GY807_03145, partial [Gammaproteobacteria bacterium]|nr:hypothetical protein [Gammaproteobacteria bacterium]